jgi:hypothetical protein
MRLTRPVRLSVPLDAALRRVAARAETWPPVGPDLDAGLHAVARAEARRVVARMLAERAELAAAEVAVAREAEGGRT